MPMPEREDIRAEILYTMTSTRCVGDPAAFERETYQRAISVGEELDHLRQELRDANDRCRRLMTEYEELQREMDFEKAGWVVAERLRRGIPIDGRTTLSGANTHG